MLVARLFFLYEWYNGAADPLVVRIPNLLAPGSKSGGEPASPGCFCTIVVFVAAVEIMTMIKTMCLQGERSAESISVFSGAGHRPPGDPSC